MSERNDKRYTVKSELLGKKYGEPVIIKIEGTDQEVFGRSWAGMSSNFAALGYGMRAAAERLPWTGNVYYGKVHGLGELVHESELGEEVAG